MVGIGVPKNRHSLSLPVALRPPTYHPHKDGMKQETMGQLERHGSHNHIGHHDSNTARLKSASLIISHLYSRRLVGCMLLFLLCRSIRFCSRLLLWTCATRITAACFSAGRRGMAHETAVREALQHCGAPETFRTALLSTRPCCALFPTSGPDVERAYVHASIQRDASR